jgi:DNA-directed RNA polymerase delta subunit
MRIIKRNKMQWKHRRYYSLDFLNALSVSMQRKTDLQREERRHEQKKTTETERQ